MTTPASAAQRMARRQAERTAGVKRHQMREAARPRQRAATPARPSPARGRTVPRASATRSAVPLPQTPSRPFAARAAAAGRVARAGGRQAGRRAMAARMPGGRNYQGIILTEFVVAVLFVSFAPLARPEGKKKAGLSPYTAGDMWRFLAIGGTYFGLAMLSAAGHTAARWASWFGGLVLLAILFQQSQNGDLQGVFVTLSHGQAAKEDRQLGKGVAAGAESGLGVGG